MGKILDYFLAKKIITAADEDTPKVDLKADEPPYTIKPPYERLPGKFKEELPQSIAEIPDLPEELVPAAKKLLGSFDRVEELTSKLDEINKTFKEAKAPIEEKRRKEEIEIQTLAQQLGETLQKLDASKETVFAKFKTMLAFARKHEEPMAEVTMSTEEKLEYVLDFMAKVDKFLHEQVLTGLNNAIEESTIVRQNMEKQTGFYNPPSEEFLKGKGRGASKIRLSQLDTLPEVPEENGLDNAVSTMLGYIGSAVSGFHKIEDMIDNALAKLKGESKVVPMEEPMAAAANRKN